MPRATNYAPLDGCAGRGMHGWWVSPQGSGVVEDVQGAVSEGGVPVLAPDGLLGVAVAGRCTGIGRVAAVAIGLQQQAHTLVPG